MDVPNNKSATPTSSNAPNAPATISQNNPERSIDLSSVRSSMNEIVSQTDVAVVPDNTKSTDESNVKTVLVTTEEAVPKDEPTLQDDSEKKNDTAKNGDPEEKDDPAKKDDYEEKDDPAKKDDYEEKDDSEKKDETWEEKRQKIPKVVNVRWVDFEHFKNRYSMNEGLEIIEVLRGHQHIANEIVRERRQRAWRRWDSKSIKSAMDIDASWIQRVRIQSPQILLLLSRLTGHSENWAIDKERVFFRPFRTFHYYLPQMKECLKILEERWAKADDQRDNEQGNLVEADTKLHKVGDDAESVTSDDAGPMDPEIAVAGQTADSVIALRHVRKYVEFVEEEIMPLWRRAAGATQRKVRFLDLWMTFQPGEILYVPQISDSSQSSGIDKPSNMRMYQTAWKLSSMVLSEVNDEIPDDTETKTKRELELYAYYIDYDGSSYGPVQHKFTILDYEGEKDIVTLEIYPLRFAKNYEKLKAQLQEQGKQFQNVMSEKHLYYDGWTLTHGPIGDTNSRTKINSEYIDSDVIIDFNEGYKADSSLSPPSFADKDETFNDSDWPTGDDQITIRQWADSSRSELLGEVKEITQCGEWFGNYLEKLCLEKSKFMKEYDAGGVKHLEGDDLELLPCRVIAYAFRERKFVMVHIQSLRKVLTPQNVFRDLKIDPNHKRMVKALVKTHFQKQRIQKSQPTVTLDQDLIRGKGSGLVILLHGVPGVGKTATAEAVAQANDKPLFVITCGDLGFTPKEVDVSLRDIFRLAHLWDCVLLLDEADIFLSRRDVSDLKRNALVSVFLRVLEYYSGILFLTTNRVGTLDEAFKSRIHVSLYYPPLTEEQTLAIFKVNIRKVHDIDEERRKQHPNGDDQAISVQPGLVIDDPSIMEYAIWHYNNHERHQRWNGRQIRNAFQIAYSLAHFDMQRTSLDEWSDDDTDTTVKDEETNKDAQATRVLDYHQFQIVADAIEKFDAYLVDAIAGNDIDNARNLGLRADDHDPSLWEEHRSVYHPAPSYGQRYGFQSQRRSSQPGIGSARPGMSRGAYRNHYPPMEPRYTSPRQDYQAPQQVFQPQSKQQVRPQRMAHRGSDPNTQQGTPLPATPRSKPPITRLGDSGYSGSQWSSESPTPGVTAAPENEYRPGDRMDNDYSNYVEGEDQAYDGYDDEY